ncbi:uncharacterized protein MELLADRAFT_68840 [Melampsora larici-populina 98AG31]|uniref:Secreted protein n=1 Tax=Melampsora larici-populina (strain 98AG31 / pathotype 3-4-7) TaxID=747676 RepID=F4S8D1_MELLP|nr:uncharacterized protein MELLADRAFT_68840 [Melampsora larici-populina 98AG31]EGF99076.1 hypothetical protein MELLADRAFT_68840 [Melampsora larici-populina 98AG31]
MFYNRILISLSLISLFQQTVMGQCLPLRGAAPIDIEQCRKALATYKFEDNSALDSDGYKNKKTCGNCAISMSRVSTDPKVKPSLDGYDKKFLEETVATLSQKCTIKGTKGMLPSIFVGTTVPADGTYFAIEIEVGDMKRNECSSKPQKTTPKKTRRSPDLRLSN